MKPEEKIGLYIEKHIAKSEHAYRSKTQLPAYHGYLKLKRVFTSLIYGIVKEEDLNTDTFFLSCFELAKLKKILEDFDARLLIWKTDDDLQKERKI